MSASPSCLSFILCKRNKKSPSKSLAQSNFNISSLQEFISQKNSSTQTPLSNDIGLKRGSSLTHIAAVASLNHKSSIVVKKADNFFPQHQVSEKLETAESEWSIPSFANKLSSDKASPDSFLSSQSISKIFNSKKEGISWNKNCSQTNSSSILTDPFVSNATQNRPRIIAITPSTCLRKRLLPSMLKNHQPKYDNLINSSLLRSSEQKTTMPISNSRSDCRDREFQLLGNIIANSQKSDNNNAELLQQESKVNAKDFSNKIDLQITDQILDVFEGEISNSLVNL